MNWYKFSQLYEDIIPDPLSEYGDEKSDYFKAEQYFSIGQNDETINKSWCWIWMNGELLTKKGPTTHRKEFGQDVENYYRGWYDPIQKLISIVVPSGPNNFSYIPGAIYTKEDVPEILLQQLNRKFKNAQIKVF